MTHKLPRLVNDIQDLPRSAYAEAVEKYVECVSNNQFVRAVYECGTIANPGISDIDLLVVVDGIYDPLGLNSLSVFQRKFRDLTSYLFVHDIYLYDLRSFENVNFTNYFKNLSLVYGDHLKVNIPSEHELSALSVQIIFDFVSSRLSQFCRMLYAKKLGRRGLLLRVSSIKHTYTLLQNLGIEDPEIEEFVQRVYEVRDSPQSFRDEHILSLFTESFYYFNKALTLAASFFVDNYLIYFTALGNSNTLRLNDFIIVRFVDNPDQIYRTEIPTDVVYYPKEAFFHYLAFTNKENLLGLKASDVLSRSGDEICELRHDYQMALDRRLAALSDHIQFLTRNKALFAMKGNPGFTAT